MAKFRSDGRERIVRYFLVANLALWVLMWVTLLLHARRYSYNGEPIEGPYPWQVVFGWALSPTLDPMRYLGYRLVFIANFPSYLVTKICFNVAFHGQRSPVQYLGTTVGGYELLAWMILSFVQWYAIGRLALLAWRKCRRPSVA